MNPAAEHCPRLRPVARAYHCDPQPVMATSPPLNIKVSFVVLTDRRVSRAARLLYSALCAEVGNSGRRAVAVPWLAKRAGASDRAVRRWIAQLVKAGHIRRQAQAGRANVFELMSGGSIEAGTQAAE